MVADKPFHRLAFLGGQAEAGRDAAGDLGAEDRMILGPALADVMQEQRHIDHAAVDPVGQDAVGDGQFFIQLVPLDLGQRRDALDRMFVHRVVVVDVELHHGHDALELGDEGAEHAQLVHPAQRPFGIAVAQQRVEEDPVRLAVVLHLLVDQMQVGRDQPHGARMDQEARAQRLLEDAQEVQLVGEEGLGIEHVDPAVHETVARLQPLLAPEEAHDLGLALLVARFELREEDAGQLSHAGGLAEIILHEDLDPAAAAGVGIAHAGGHLDLQVEGQLVGRAAGGVMQVAAHRPEKGFGALEGLELVPREQARRHEARGRGDAVEVFPDPVERLEVAQPALALLDVGFEHIALAALPLVALAAFLELGVDEFRARAAEEVVPERLVEPRPRAARAPRGSGVRGAPCGS